MTKTQRTIVIIVGAACFVLAALASLGWVGKFEPNVTALALFGFACWLASSL